MTLFFFHLDYLLYLFKIKVSQYSSTQKFVFAKITLPESITFMTFARSTLPKNIYKVCPRRCHRAILYIIIFIYLFPFAEYSLSKNVFSFGRKQKFCM